MAAQVNLIFITNDYALDLEMFKIKQLFNQF